MLNSASVLPQLTKDAKLRKIFGTPLNRAKYACVYAIGPEKGRPLKIGYATNIATRVNSIQSCNWMTVKCHAIAWSTGPKFAQLIEAKCHEILDKASKRITGEWFDITPEWAAKVIAHAAQELDIQVISHVEMLKKCQRQRNMAADWDIFWDRPGSPEPFVPKPKQETA